ncbi:hypothetical protein [Antarcticimicrobium sediminis]|uniref:Uncharacterized protein n=1 Tax=Antarcticimicrobium sediminis TaxID=2546227 RepID=A0A4R5F1F3_9RHOB|nr:hypothetical protein [Antarcticimicrobium sediminis]TDE40947.1 hypothetical protein E1B25_01665 [Antarcticimicrobium sediminis]
MKKPRHHITDHAVVRYLERVKGVDIDALRSQIGRKVDLAIEMGANGAVSGGFVYRIEAGRVVTVVQHSQPERKTGRSKFTGDQQ